MNPQSRPMQISFFNDAEIHKHIGTHILHHVCSCRKRDDTCVVASIYLLQGDWHLREGKHLALATRLTSVDVKFWRPWIDGWMIGWMDRYGRFGFSFLSKCIFGKSEGVRSFCLQGILQQHRFFVQSSSFLIMTNSLTIRTETETWWKRRHAEECLKMFYRSLIFAWTRCLCVCAVCVPLFVDFFPCWCVDVFTI